MDLIEQHSELPRLTRLVHAFSLGVLEGMSLGFAAATFVHSNRLAQFVVTNRIATGIRKEMLSIVILPALLLPLVIAGSCAMPKLAGKRLSSMEDRFRLLAPICAVGFIPIIFQPTIWRDKPLAFLLATGLLSIITAKSVYLSLLVWSARRRTAPNGDLRLMADALAARISPKACSFLATGLLSVFILVCVTHGPGNLNLAATGIGNEWETLRHFSKVGGLMTWFSLEGLRVTGHASWLGVIYSVFAWFWPKLEGLLILRLLTVALAAVPLFFWCKKSLGILSALLISLAFLSMPSLGMIGLTDSFPITCALGCFFLSAYYFENGQNWRGLPLVLLGISINEQVAIWYSMFGLYLVTFSSRRMVGKRLAIASACYFVIVALLVLPHFGLKTYLIDLPNVPSIGIQNLGATMVTLIVNPAYALSRWFDAQNLEYWLAMSVPFAFLPFRGSRWVIWLTPVLFFAGTLPLRESNSQWRNPAFGHFLALGFLTTVASLRQIRQSPAEGPLRYRAALAGWVAALLPCIAVLGSLFYRSS